MTLHFHVTSNIILCTERIHLGVWGQVYISTFLGLRMDLVGTVSSLASASSTLEVRDHHHDAWLGLPVIFMYNMSI